MLELVTTNLLNIKRLFHRLNCLAATTTVDGWYSVMSLKAKIKMPFVVSGPDTPIGGAREQTKARTRVRHLLLLQPRPRHCVAGNAVLFRAPLVLVVVVMMEDNLT